MPTTLHPQWEDLDIAKVLSYPSALIIVDATNSVLAEGGAQKDTQLWSRARQPHGTLENSRRLISAARATGIKVVWFRYEYLRDDYPGTPMDIVQYRYWIANRSFTPEQKTWEAALVDEMEALHEHGDIDLVYRSFGNIFLGTPLQQILTALGIRTLLLSGYHLDECVEQAARTARDLGFMPIVVEDCCLCVHEEDEEPASRRIDSHWAPVLTCDQLIDQGLIAFRQPGRPS